MKFDKWLDQETGRTKALADYFGVTLGAITQWRTNGVPKNRMLDVHQISNGAVTFEEMLMLSSRLSTSEGV